MVRPRQRLYCSFCGKHDGEVVHMVAGPTVFICNECVRLCQDIIDMKMAHQGMTIEQERAHILDLQKSRASTLSTR